jgi:hypothetical protein
MTQLDPADQRRIADVGRTRDLLLLTGVVLASVVTYVTRLGFYSDDWAFLAVMTHADDRSIAGLIDAMSDFNVTLRMRPTQMAYQAVLYSAFRLDPFGYHIVNTLVLAAMISLLYLVLREIGVPRPVAVSIALVYALLPSYSADRFWFAAFGYALSMALALGSIYTDLRALQSARRRIAWKASSLLLLAAASFGYETVIPLLMVSPVLTWLVVRRREEVAARLHGAAAVAYVLAPYVILSVAIVYKAGIDQGSGLGSNPLYLVRLAVGSVTVHFGSFGIGLPFAAWWSIGRLSAIGIAFGIAMGIVVFVFLMAVLKASERFAAARTWWRLAVAGLVVFALGYAIFLTTPRIAFGSTGISNRTGLVAALGAATVLVATIGLLTSRLASPAARRIAFAASVAAVCSMGSFVIGSLGEPWATSWLHQRSVLRDIRAALPDPPAGSTLILDGVCPYEGPAVVFESSWDLAGAVKVAYDDPTLSADVTTSTMTVGSEGIETTVYGPGTAAFHPYRQGLLVYDRARGTVVRLSHERAALEYFGTRDPRGSARCPTGVPGYGELLLPADRVFLWLEARGFGPW